MHRFAKFVLPDSAVLCELIPLSKSARPAAEILGFLHSLAFALQAHTLYIVLIRMWHTCLVLKIELISLAEAEA